MLVPTLLESLRAGDGSVAPHHILAARQDGSRSPSPPVGRRPWLSNHRPLVRVPRPIAFVGSSRAAPPYPVIDVSQWELLGVEPDGLREHPWLRDPSQDSAWLFKPVVVHGDRQQGEDWSEKVASEIGSALGIPSAVVELAQRQDRRGCISRNLRPHDWEMQPGAVLLSGTLPGYESKVKGRPGHSLKNIERALRPFSAPPGFRPADFQAFDVFAGYLVFDALIGNRDRHDHNWSVLLPPPEREGSKALCGSYDHASSLGFNLTDEARVRRLETTQRRLLCAARHRIQVRARREQPSPYIGRGDHGCSGTVHAAGTGHWLTAVSDLVPERIAAILRAVPRLSEPTITLRQSW